MYCSNACIYEREREREGERGGGGIGIDDRQYLGGGGAHLQSLL